MASFKADADAGHTPKTTTTSTGHQSNLDSNAQAPSHEARDESELVEEEEDILRSPRRENTDDSELVDDEKEAIRPHTPARYEEEHEITKKEIDVGDARSGSDSDDTHPSPESAESTPARPQSLIPVYLDERRNISRATTVASSTALADRNRLLRKETKLAQKTAHPWEHLGITLGLPMILLFDLAIPCIIYYTWYINHGSIWADQCLREYPGQPCPIPRPQYDKDILGYAIICFGFGELWILIARIWRLFFRPEDCAPLLSRSRWELDATCWVYAVALILGLIPFVIGSTKEIEKLYLYSPSFIMAFLGILMVITTAFPFTIPIGINSHARGTKLRPFIYYAAEDFIAVDGLQDREFRVRYNERYETNKQFRNFFRLLTLWWISGVCVYIGSVSAVIWTLPFHHAFGLSFGVLFAYIAVWAGVTFLWTRIEMQREHRAYEEGRIEA